MGLRVKHVLRPLQGHIVRLITQQFQPPNKRADAADIGVGEGLSRTSPREEVAYVLKTSALEDCSHFEKDHA